MTELDLRCVVEADPLQLGQRAGGAQDQNAPPTRWLVNSTVSPPCGYLLIGLRQQMGSQLVEEH
jgi:hypothetical protein